MRTTPKVVGVVGAGWIALGLGVMHFATATSEHFPVKSSTTSESSHRALPADHASQRPAIHLLKQWFDAVNAHREAPCTECGTGATLLRYEGDNCGPCDHSRVTASNEGDVSWTRKDGGCIDRCDHNGDTLHKKGGNPPEHKPVGCNDRCDHGNKTGEHTSDGCSDPCDHGNEPIKVVVIVKLSAHHNGCDTECDHNRDPLNNGAGPWNHAGDQCPDGCDSRIQSDLGQWDTCDQSTYGTTTATTTSATGPTATRTTAGSTTAAENDGHQLDYQVGESHGLPIPVVGGPIE